MAHPTLLTLILNSFSFSFPFLFSSNPIEYPPISF